MGGRASQSGDNFRMLKSSQESEVTRSHSSVLSVNLGKVGSPLCISFGFGSDTSLAAILDLSSSSSFSLAREKRTVVGARNQR